MGMNHCRVLANSQLGTLSCVVDDVPQRAESVGKTYGVPALSDIVAAAELVDAAIVAVPDDAHFEVASILLEAGIHILIEKPIAPTVDQGIRLIELAESRGVTLMVGHIERFNPAVLELDYLTGEILHFRASRISPYTPRIQSSVITDLMVHDIDLALSVVKSTVVNVHAVSRSIISDSDDIASAVLEFENGVVADLTASRVGQHKVRELVIAQRHRYISVDLIRQVVSISSIHRSDFVTENGPAYRESGIVEIPFLQARGEPLGAEVDHFLECVRTRAEPRTTGRDGVEAVRVAHWIREASHAT